MTTVRKIIRADGTETHLTEKVSIRRAAELINADMVDSVILRHMGKQPLHVMIVDDNGWETRTETDVIDGNVFHNVITVKPKRPINEKATALYLQNCRPGATHQIAGDVLICPDDDFAS